MWCALSRVRYPPSEQTCAFDDLPERARPSNRNLAPAMTPTQTRPTMDRSAGMVPCGGRLAPDRKQLVELVVQVSMVSHEGASKRGDPVRRPQAGRRTGSRTGPPGWRSQLFGTARWSLRRCGSDGPSPSPAWTGPEGPHRMHSMAGDLGGYCCGRSAGRSMVAATAQWWCRWDHLGSADTSVVRCDCPSSWPGAPSRGPDQLLRQSCSIHQPRRSLPDRKRRCSKSSGTAKGCRAIGGYDDRGGSDLCLIGLEGPGCSIKTCGRPGG